VDLGVLQRKITEFSFLTGLALFIIENLDNLNLLLEEAKDKSFIVYTFPVNMHGFTGLPCRVVAGRNIV